MEGENEDHRIRQRSTTSDPLFTSHADVDEGPENQARSEFIE